MGILKTQPAPAGQMLPSEVVPRVTGVMLWLSVLSPPSDPGGGGEGAHPLGVFGAWNWAHRVLHLVHPF